MVVDTCRTGAALQRRHHLGDPPHFPGSKIPRISYRRVKWRLNTAKQPRVSKMQNKLHSLHEQQLQHYIISMSLYSNSSDRWETLASDHHVVTRPIISSS